MGQVKARRNAATTGEAVEYPEPLDHQDSLYEACSIGVVAMTDSEYNRNELAWEVEYRRTHGMAAVTPCESCHERLATRETIGGLLCEFCRYKIERFAGND